MRAPVEVSVKSDTLTHQVVPEAQKPLTNLGEWTIMVTFQSVELELTIAWPTALSEERERERDWVVPVAVVISAN